MRRRFGAKREGLKLKQHLPEAQGNDGLVSLEHLRQGLLVLEKGRRKTGKCLPCRYGVRNMWSDIK